MDSTAPRAVSPRLAVAALAEGELGGGVHFFALGSERCTITANGWSDRFRSTELCRPRSQQRPIRRRSRGCRAMRAFCRGRGTSRAIDLRAGDRHPLPSVRALVAGCGEQTEEL